MIRGAEIRALLIDADSCCCRQRRKGNAQLTSLSRLDILDILRDIASFPLNVKASFPAIREIKERSCVSSKRGTEPPQGRFEVIDAI
jgi:hypothetical protein